MPTVDHVGLAVDELEGMQALGYPCGQFYYAAKKGVTSKTGRLRVIVNNALALVKEARSFKPDIIYFNSRLEVLAGMRDFMTIAIFKSLYSGKVKFVIKSHGSDLEVLTDQRFSMKKVVMPFLKKNVAAWLLLSSEEKRAVEHTGYFTPGSIYVTKNIVRLDNFKPDSTFRSRHNVPANHKVLLFVGRLIKEKGIYDVLNAFAQIKDSYPLTLIVVGGGAEAEQLKELSLTLDISNNVIFTGFIPEQEVVSYYSNCDILVFPTYFPEGLPMALFNSVAAGMAAITTPTRAATDYLTEPDNCLWVKPQDAGSVNAALQKLLQNEELTKSMKVNNIAKGIEFGKGQVCTELSTIIEQIMKR
jgi:glycosyltransferase involved in cell wall biosynthesis